MGIEIERKYLVKKLPNNLSDFPSYQLTQAYLNTEPVVRVRRENDKYYLTYKGRGLLTREEYNLPLDEVSFLHLLGKADGNIISKTRYKIPYSIHNNNYTIELDVFDKPFTNLIIAEVEFNTEEEANNFLMPEWFSEEVTYDPQYHNSNLSKKVCD